jgi:hypothetical protein
MKLTHQPFTDFYPMLPSRRFSPAGADLMPPKLRLRGHDDNSEQTDSIPFPRTVSRIGRWQPKPLHDAEQAAQELQSHLDRLSILLDDNNDDDRPRAA